MQRLKKHCIGNPLVVRWLVLHTLTAEGPGLIPYGGTKAPQAKWCGKTQINKRQAPPQSHLTVETYCSEEKKKDSFQNIVKYFEYSTCTSSPKSPNGDVTEINVVFMPANIASILQPMD